MFLLITFKNANLEIKMKASLAAIEKNPNAQGIIFTFHGIGCLLDGAIMHGYINCVHGANASAINGGSYL